jgi:ribosomal protein S21
MINIELNGKNSLDSALKQLKFKFIKRGVTKELNDRKTFKKKSVIRREQIRNANYLQRKRSESERD